MNAKQRQKEAIADNKLNWVQLNTKNMKPKVMNMDEKLGGRTDVPARNNGELT